MGAAKFAGRPESTVARAAGPPAEAPIATRQAGFRMVDSGRASPGPRGWGGAPAVSLPMGSILERRADLPEPGPGAGDSRTGVSTASSAPALMASKTCEEGSVTLAVGNAVGAGGAGPAQG